MYAQYFFHIYGSPHWEENQWGVNTVQMGQGHVISGLGTNQNNFVKRLEVTRTDNQGNIPGAPYFNRAYRLFDPAGVTMYATDGKVIELNSSWLGVGGSCRVGPTGLLSKVYYCVLDSAGNFVRITYYDDPVDEYYQTHAIRLSPGGTEVYLTGLANDTNTGENLIFVLKLQLNGDLIWSHTYDLDPTVYNDDRAYDIVEDPYTGEVVVVGTTMDINSFDVDAFFMRLNAANGGVIGFDTYGTTASYDHFNSVEYSNDPNYYGYIMGGYTNNTPAADYDTWLVRLDANYAVIWSNTYDYNMSAVDNYCRDVIERFNTGNTYEYYAGGIANTGVFGASDMEVDKVDFAGTLVGQYTYGTTAGESLSTLDQNNSGTGDGLTIFGLTNYGPPSFGNNDLCIVKTYFNGYAPCIFKQLLTSTSSGPGYISSFAMDTVHVFDTILGTAIHALYLDSTICYQTTVTGGDNRMLEAGNENPIEMTTSQNGHALNLQLDGVGAGMVQLTLTDMLGRTLYQGNLPVQEGQNTLVLPWRETYASGVYLVNILQQNRMVSRKVVLTD